MTLQNALSSLSNQYPTQFLRAMEFLLPWECVFVKGHDGDYTYVIPENVAGDSGGITKYGIDKHSHPNVDVENLSLMGAASIYYAGEWTAIRGNDLPPNVAITTFDSAVNVGTARAGKWLQSALGVKQDGLIGPITITYAQSAGTDVVGDVLNLREDYYRSIGTGSHAKFLQGWLNRTKALRNFL